MTQKTILVIEDERDIVELIRYNLERESFRVKAACDGETGLHSVQRDLPDLILLDLMLPKLDGLEVCKRAKENERTAHIPIVMVTAKSEESDIVVGLSLGADDYITKPFSPGVLVARVKAVLRRMEMRETGEQKVIKVSDDFVIDAVRHEILVDGKPVKVTKTEFKLLKFMAERPGRALTRNQLLDGAIGFDAFVSDRNIDVHVAALRKKLKKHAHKINTIRGVGYRFEE
ncbi:MAG: DNA-binding response regulator [Planctomycetota bacterium]|nr:MAG: DNA-binding response regulator [Planctomycetota bacterium]